MRKTILRKAVRIATVLTAAFPLCLCLSLYLLSWRGAFLIGHWPDTFREPITTMGGDDSLFRLLFRAVSFGLFLPLPFSLLLFALGSLRLADHYGRRVLGTQIFLYLGGWILLLVDPVSRLVWFLG